MSAKKPLPYIRKRFPSYAFVTNSIQERAQKHKTQTIALREFAATKNGSDCEPHPSLLKDYSLRLGRRCCGCARSRGCRRHICPLRFDIRIHFSQPDIGVHVAVDVVFREHKVHGVAGGFVIITPLETGAIKRELIEQVVDDGLWHPFKPCGIAAVVGKVIILRSVLRGFDAVVGQVMLDIVPDEFVIAQDIEIRIHFLVYVNRSTEGMMADVFEIGLKTRHIGDGVAYQVFQQRDASLRDVSVARVDDCDADIGVFQIMICHLKIGNSVTVYAAKTGLDNVLIAPIVFGGNTPAVLNGIMK